MYAIHACVLLVLAARRRFGSRRLELLAGVTAAAQRSWKERFPSAAVRTAQLGPRGIYCCQHFVWLGQKGNSNISPFTLVAELKTKASETGVLLKRRLDFSNPVLGLAFQRKTITRGVLLQAPPKPSKTKRGVLL